MENRLRIIIEVIAGIIPAEPMQEFTQKFYITEEQWEDATGNEAMKVYGHAQEYMRSLWNPKIVNWVRLDWIYL